MDKCTLSPLAIEVSEVSGSFIDKVNKCQQPAMDSTNHGTWGPGTHQWPHKIVNDFEMILTQPFDTFNM